MGEAIEVWRGGVATWECDAMGHLNVAFYVAKAAEGLVGMAAELGMPQAFAPAAPSTLIIRDQHIRFLREARPGTALTMTGQVAKMGESEARLVFAMRHPSGELAATFQIVVVHATAREGRPFPWPERVRARAAELTAPVPAEAAPKSLSLAPVETTASLERADALGLRRTGIGAVGPADCDAFGRWRPEMFMGRISDGIPHLFDAGRPGGDGGARVGGAALEYRLVQHDWPKAGDRVVLRSGQAGGDARFRRLVHWLLDPRTGRPWASAEAIACSFDLETRKIIALEGAELAAVKARDIPGLAL